MPARIRRQLRELAAVARSRRVEPARAAPKHDSWLETFWAEELNCIEAALPALGPAAFSRFRELDSDLWALLLTQDYDVYPNIKAVLPDVPDRALQETWNGASGAALASQSRAFYDKLRRRYELHSDRVLRDSRVLDFGCGWGRLTRLLARDVEPGNLYGCDPVQPILDVCRRTGVPATLARSEFVPDDLPFDQPFDLAYAFSVFTHLSEGAHEASLNALHRSLAPGGVLVATIRPPEYLYLAGLMAPALASLGANVEDGLKKPQYLFEPHATQPLGAETPEGGVTYGETVITMAYVRQRWAERFDLLDVDLLLEDPYQVMLTMRARPSASPG